MIHPDFALEHAWEYQALLTEMQTEINGLVNEMQTLVSNILESSTSETLTQYYTHIVAIQAEYVPMLEAFNALAPGECRTNAETMLNSTTQFTGFETSNCASVYNQRVKLEIDNANKALVRFDDLYSQVQTIVVKGFIAQNAFLTPEQIVDDITYIYEAVQARWAISKPELEAVKNTLQTVIADQNRILGNCHNSVQNFAQVMFGMFRSSVQTCSDYNNTPSSLNAKAALVSALQEFKDYVASRPKFVWE